MDNCDICWTPLSTEKVLDTGNDTNSAFLYVCLGFEAAAHKLLGDVCKGARLQVSIKDKVDRPGYAQGSNVLAA